jgi:hypothetical protein
VGIRPQVWPTARDLRTAEHQGGPAGQPTQEAGHPYQAGKQPCRSSTHCMSLPLRVS